MCGIYFLYLRNKLIYIGQSTNIRSRLKSHLNSKLFTRVETFLCHSSELNHYEKKFIEEMKPTLNTHHTGKRKSSVKPQVFKKSLKKRKLIGI